MKGYAVTDLVSYYQATPKLRLNLDLKNLLTKYMMKALSIYMRIQVNHVLFTGYELYVLNYKYTC